MISTNRLRVPQAVLPLGMYLVADAVRTAGHQVSTLDLCFRAAPHNAVRKAILDTRPDVIGLSIRNLDNSDASCTGEYVTGLKPTMETIRRYHPGMVVLGGPAVSIAPQMLLKRLGAEYAFVGEGEHSFPLFLRGLDDGEYPEDNVIRCEPSCVLPSASLPGPGSGLDMRCYAAYGSPIPIQTRRGCAMNCVYCTYPTIEGSSYRLKPPRLVADEIEQAVSKCSLRSVEFVDSVFNHPAHHAISVCEELEGRGNKVPLYTASINPTGASTAVFRLMERAGFTAITASLESASDAVLAALKKGYTSREVAETVRAARMTRMARMWVFVLGGPGETERTACETLSFIKRYISERDFVMITCGLRIYPGTELEQIARREGSLTDERDMLYPTFYFSPATSMERLRQLIRRADLPSAGTIFISDIGSPALPVVQRLHSMLRMRPPYWRHSGSLLRLRRVFG